MLSVFLLCASYRSHKDKDFCPLVHGRLLSWHCRSGCMIKSHSVVHFVHDHTLGWCGPTNTKQFSNIKHVESSKYFTVSTWLMMNDMMLCCSQSADSPTILAEESIADLRSSWRVNIIRDLVEEKFEFWMRKKTPFDKITIAHFESEIRNVRKKTHWHQTFHERATMEKNKLFPLSSTLSFRGDNEKNIPTPKEKKTCYSQYCQYAHNKEDV